MTQSFLIIGGGIAGISAAARLSHLGPVTLLEAEANLAHHASSRSAALFEPRYGLPPVVALSLASADYLSTANGGVLSPRGLMVIARPDQRREFDADIAHFGLAELPLAKARAMVPILAP
ncbi:MAG: FAD-binding oxidoreductase, partial [Paracoccaceae bacterium]|nr:FAD-binding oxidoreductase [Paracoccaceae bacterium]